MGGGRRRGGGAAGGSWGAGRRVGRSSGAPLVPAPLAARSLAGDARAPRRRRLVADAQSREAPVQRLADVVAGKFCYGVMAASAATFGFWSLAGADLFPQALGEPGAPQRGRGLLLRVCRGGVGAAGEGLELLWRPPGLAI